MLAPWLIADPSGSTIGYLIIFAFYTFGFLLVLLLIPSLRKYRRKRNLVIYAVAGIILSSLLLQAYEVSLRSPLFTVGIADSSDIQTLKADQVSQLNFTCTTYGGGKTASFYLVFTGVNISFTDKQQGYVLTNSTTIKIPFTASQPKDLIVEQVRSVFFQIDENVTGFQLHPKIEAINGQVMLGSGIWEIRGIFNSTERGYTMSVAIICV